MSISVAMRTSRDKSNSELQVPITAREYPTHAYQPRSVTLHCFGQSSDLCELNRHRLDPVDLIHEGRAFAGEHCGDPSAAVPIPAAFAGGVIQRADHELSPGSLAVTERTIAVAGRLRHTDRPETVRAMTRERPRHDPKDR